MYDRAAPLMVRRDCPMWEAQDDTTLWDVALLNSSHGMACGSVDTIRRTVDGGVTWQSGASSSHVHPFPPARYRPTHSRAGISIPHPPPTGHHAITTCARSPV